MYDPNGKNVWSFPYSLVSKLVSFLKYLTSMIGRGQHISSHAKLQDQVAQMLWITEISFFFTLFYSFFLFLSVLPCFLLLLLLLLLVLLPLLPFLVLTPLLPFLPTPLLFFRLRSLIWLNPEIKSAQSSLDTKLPTEYMTDIFTKRKLPISDFSIFGLFPH